MAHLLEALIKHFDLCVSAVKHTEGGLTAVQNLAHDLPDSASVTAALTSSNAALELEPISAADRLDMLSVLEKDAAEVEDVVLELQERLIEMEEAFAQIQSHVDSLHAASSATSKAYATLEELQLALPTYVTSTGNFTARWLGTKATIDTLASDLDGYRHFYEEYLAAYYSCVEEQRRREDVEHRKETILRKAIREVQKLEEGDRAVRDAFRRGLADFLPVDLWPGLEDPGRTWNLVEGADLQVDSRGNGQGGAVEAADIDRVDQR
jgi:autophagy-related protein 17